MYFGVDDGNPDDTVVIIESDTAECYHAGRGCFSLVGTENPFREVSRGKAQETRSPCQRCIRLDGTPELTREQAVIYEIVAKTASEYDAGVPRTELAHRAEERGIPAARALQTAGFLRYHGFLTFPDEWGNHNLSLGDKTPDGNPIRTQ
jgi:hypothetical protein